MPTSPSSSSQSPSFSRSHNTLLHAHPHETPTSPIPRLRLLISLAVIATCICLLALLTIPGLDFGLLKDEDGRQRDQISAGSCALPDLMPIFPTAGGSVPVGVNASVGGRVAVGRESGEKRAVVSLLLSNDYNDALRVLIHSLRMVNTSADMILAYVPELVSERTLCRVRSYGWKTRPVSKVYPVTTPARGIKNIRYFYTYTKLRIWEWVDYDSVVFLDADTLVVRNFDELFELPVDFAAVLDVWWDSISSDFNVGVLVVRPSLTEYHSLLENMQSEQDNYDIVWAEQAFLGHHYKDSVHLIPLIYNLNLALVNHPRLLKRLWPRAKVIHFTVEKPFQMVLSGGGVTKTKRIVPKDPRFQAMFDSWVAVSDDEIEWRRRRRQRAAYEGGSEVVVDGGADDGDETACMALSDSVTDNDPVFTSYRWTLRKRWLQGFLLRALFMTCLVATVVKTATVFGLFGAFVMRFRRLRRMWRHGAAAVVSLPFHDAIVGKDPY